MIQAKNLAERGVGVGVRAARERNHRRELRVAQARKRASQSGKTRRKRSARTGVVRAQPDHHKDAGADDRADAQGRQLKDAQSALQTVLAGFRGLPPSAGSAAS